jgi:hypothetical protein
MTKTLLISLIATLPVLFGYGQQVADTLYHPPIPNPAYAIGHGSLIFIDEAHGNFHTMSGRFLPFASVLIRDGYNVRPFKERFSKEKLASAKILVIANALHADNQQRWSLPTPSAFTDEEVSIVNDWVKNGGSLFLIADHMPFPGAAEKLALSFGIKFYNGFAKKKNSGKDIFKEGSGLLENVIVKGRNQSETITSLQSFGGQAFQISDSAHAIIELNEKYEILLPATAWEFKRDTERISADKFVQGAYMKYRKGRIVFFGEAGMFTAQIQGSKNKFGMNSASASQNFQFLLNTIHWLDRIID